MTNETKPKTPYNKIFVTFLISIIFLLEGIVAYDHITGGALAYEKWLSFGTTSHQNTKSSVSINSGEIFGIEPAQEALIIEYMLRYYEGIANLENANLGSLYLPNDPEAMAGAAIDQTAADYLVALRTMQPLNLRMNNYEVGITYMAVEKTENDDVHIRLQENAIVHFVGTPKVQSSTAGVAHDFTLRNTAEGLKIMAHHKEEDSYLLIEECYNEKMVVQPVEDINQAMTEIKTKLLDQAKATIENQNRQRVSLKTDANTAKEAAHGYEREAAVTYATEWVDAFSVKRNPEWLYYDGYGGNCNNYISQSLYAGGIPMDIVGDAQWKWYDDEVDYFEQPLGRSPSWAGVEEFYRYAESNVGSGLVADVGLNAYKGQKGDVLQYSADGDWRHSVIIADLIYDQDNNPVDYLIHSNTADRKNYPASAYAFYDFRLIKVLGWND